MDELTSWMKHALTNLNRRRGAGLVVAAIAISSLGAGAIAWPSVRPSCTLRYEGSTANLEVSGLAAGAVCADIAAGDLGWVEAKPAGMVICRVQLDGREAVVRDSTWIRIFGELMCDGLRRRAAR